MNNQEVFVKVAVHLLTQNLKSRETPWGGPCRYRGYDNTKCAVGCLIPDELYSTDMEGKGVTGLSFQYPYLGLSEHVELLDSLQKMHDFFEPHEWMRELRSIADKHNLNPGILNSFPYF